MIVMLGNAIAIALLAGSLFAQPKAFDVAAIHENRSGAPTEWKVTPQRFHAQNVNLQELVAISYLVNTSRVQGKVPWFTSVRFDVEATVEVRPENIQELIQALVKDRFAATI